MNSSPLISVIVPVYNTAPYLRQCLDSICNQTYKNLEIICVNDGSTDNSAEILAEYAAKDSRFRVIHQQNKGLASARNKALDCATGDFISNVDSDDYLDLHAYERVLQNFTDDIDMVWIGNHIVGDVDENHMNKQRKFYNFQENGKVALETIPLANRSGAVWNKIVRRSIIEKYHLRYAHGLIFEDLCFCANLYPVLGGVYFLPEKLYYYLQREDSIMGVTRTKTSDQYRDYLKIIKPMFDFYTANGFIQTHSDIYASFFSKFYNLAHHFCPEEQKDNLVTEVPRLLKLYGSNDPDLRDRIRRKLMDKIYGPRKTHKIRFLGIPIYSETKSWDCIVRRILGIRIDEQSGGPTYTSRNNPFYKETPQFSMYRFFGIPLYTKEKDATKARKILGITVRRKKAKQPPIITANISYLTPNQRLKGKKVVITGANRGLGLSIAERFVSEGAEVLITGRNAKQLQDIAARLGCKYLTLDVLNVSSFEDFFEKADAQFEGGVNCLINNAGVSLHEQNIRHVTPEGFETQINTNLRGAYFLSQHFIKRIESTQRKDCSILFISSERGLFVDDIPYGLSKAAINSLVQGLAVRVLQSGIRVNAIAPGITASDMTGFTTDGNLFCNYNASKRVFLPEEVSETACFLISDCSRCITGQIIACDQGRAINPHWRRN